MNSQWTKYVKYAIEICFTKMKILKHVFENYEWFVFNLGASHFPDMNTFSSSYTQFYFTRNHK